MRNLPRLASACALLVALAACGGDAGRPSADLREAAGVVAGAFAARDFERLAGLVHPEVGVRFSPYAYVAPEHVTLTRDDLLEAAQGGVLTRTWGSYDGTGDPIELGLREYVDRYVYDAPYLAEGAMAIDRRQGHGNSLDNAADVYPGASIVEYHVPGRDPRYGGMDWRSLRLAFEDRGGRWYLVGVVHDEWTI